jgi:hypothetical protein
MGLRYPGGLISATPPTVSQSSAKGVWTLEEALQYIKAGTWPPSAAGADPYFENVTMLLPGNGTNGAQNNTFLDSSTNNFTITRNGNTTQGTFTPFSKVDGRWATFFNGSSDTLISSGTPINIGTTGDFTMELWIYPVAVSGAFNVIVNTNSTGGFGGGVNSNGTITFGRALIATDGTTSNAVNFNQWNHVAWVRSSGTLKIYINGTSGFSAANSSSYPSGAARLGSDNNNTIYFNGYMSNFRFTTTAVYTANFTPPTAPLTAISGTTILTCQSNRYIDNGASALTFTIQGAPSIQTFSPFPTLTAYASGTNGGSGYFDGTGDYLDTASSSTELAMGTSAFTIEAWIYTADTSFMIACSTTTGGCGFGYNIDNGTQGLWVGRAGTGVDATSGVQLAYNAWNHVAVTRDGSNVVKFWVNGTQSGSNTTVTTNYGTSAQAVRIAADSNASLFNLSGYLSSVRITKGAALYTGTFTPSSTPLTTTVSSGTVSFLTNFTNGGIIDNAMSNDLETVGNAQISTTQSKFGGSSMYFDGNGDYLRIRDSQNFVFGTGDFTIEFWVYYNSGLTADVALFDGRPSGTNGVYPLIFSNTTGKLVWYINSAARITGTTTLSTSTWYHVAVARSGTNTKLFLNGTQEGSTYTDSNSYLLGTDRPIIAAAGATLGADPLNGYIDDLRITKGYARYTANFTAPAVPFPLFGD